MCYKRNGVEIISSKVVSSFLPVYYSGEMMQRITDSIYVDTGFRGCDSSFVVTSEGVVIIDTPMVPSEARRWRDEALKHGEIRYVINGEPHTDYAAGDFWFDGELVAREVIRRVLESRSREDLENEMKCMAPDELPVDKYFH